MARIIHRVFVSSTFEDLREERAEVQKALLMLDCFPVGMELFAAADEETWEFIKRQIAESDYYVVIVAGKYGSTAADGKSYTEKEYDFAREIGKPSIAFLRNKLDELQAKFIETDAEKRTKLEIFREKIKPYPVRSFESPHQLATEVLASLVKLRDSHPRPGFIRADEAADLKRYTQLLEEVVQLRLQLEGMKQTNPFAELPALKSVIVRKMWSSSPEKVVVDKPSWDDLILIIGRQLVLGAMSHTSTAGILAKGLTGAPAMTMDTDQMIEIMRPIATAGIVESYFDDKHSYWKLTEGGRKLYAQLSAATAKNVATPKKQRPARRTKGSLKQRVKAN